MKSERPRRKVTFQPGLVQSVLPHIYITGALVPGSPSSGNKTETGGDKNRFSDLCSCHYFLLVVCLLSRFPGFAQIRFVCPALTHRAFGKQTLVQPPRPEGRAVPDGSLFKQPTLFNGFCPAVRELRYSQGKGDLAGNPREIGFHQMSSQG